MLKKIVGGTLLAGFIGILVFGAINRTLDRTEKVAEARGLENGRNGDAQGSNGRGGSGQGRAGAGGAERQYSNLEIIPETWETYEGTVLQTPEDDGELVIMSTTGEEVTIGTGPSYMAAQGYTLQKGEQVQVQGYWEANEFKATQVTRLADGQTISLRDQYGRPAWAGAGRNAQGSGQGRESAPADQTGVGQAQLNGWLQFQGTVVSVDPDTLLVQTTDGQEIIVENRPWWFAQEMGFSIQVNDDVILTGFFEGEDFEVGRIENVSSDQIVLIRDENGRPMWAGSGRRGA